MGGWVLMIFTGCCGSGSEIQIHRDLPEAQCKVMALAVKSLQEGAAVVCVGPDGTRLNLLDG